MAFTAPPLRRLPPAWWVEHRRAQLLHAAARRRRADKPVRPPTPLPGLHCCSLCSRCATRVAELCSHHSSGFHSTFRITANTVTAVIVSRAWDFFFTRFVFFEPGQPLTCEEYVAYFWCMVLLGPIVLVALDLFSIKEGSVVGGLVSAAVGLLGGWAFMGCVVSCHDVVFEGAARTLTSWPRWAKDQGLHVVFAVGCTSFAVLFAYMAGRAHLSARKVGGGRTARGRGGEGRRGGRERRERREGGEARGGAAGAASDGCSMRWVRTAHAASRATSRLLATCTAP